jgi:flagellar motor switch protein FliN/FliY
MSSLPSSSSSTSLPPADLAPAFAGLLDVRCPVSIVLGSGTISVRECLALGPRSLVRLKQTAGEDLQVLVGQVPVARAEVVIVDEGTAVRLTEILRPAETGGR